MGPTRSPISSQAGFTLVELLVSVLIISIGLAGTVALIDRANARTVSTRAKEAGTALQREIVERVRSVPYPRITRTGLQGQLEALPGLEDASAAAGYQLKRRGFIFNVALDVCTKDDPRDGSGSQDAGSFCTASTPGTADRNADDYRLVTVDLTWTSEGDRGRAHEQALINNPGNAAGPAVTALTTPATSNGTITDPALTTVTFDVTTSYAPATVSWAVDSSDQGTATGSGTAWTFGWSVGSLVDGTYLVSAKAFDTDGRSGPQKAMTVTLNRFAPQAPTGLAAGRNGAYVEAEWLANPERDVLGYRLYRRVPDGAWQQVTGECAADSGSLVEGTTCRDVAPPDVSDLDYALAAVDRDSSGNLREGALSTPVRVTQSNQAPNPPTSLTAESGDQLIVLRWVAADPPDPDSGDSIAFYRIYRDGTAYADRYDRTATGAELAFVDRRSPGETHSYYVTAVDEELAESPVVGPVTL